MKLNQSKIYFIKKYIVELYLLIIFKINYRSFGLRNVRNSENNKKIASIPSSKSKVMSLNFLVLSKIFILKWYEIEKNVRSPYLRGWKQHFLSFLNQNYFKVIKMCWLFFCRSSNIYNNTSKVATIVPTWWKAVVNYCLNYYYFIV